MINPPQEPDVVPGRTIAGVGIATVIATIAGVLVAYGIAECRLRGLGIAAVTEGREQVREEVNAIERDVFAESAQGLVDHRQAEVVLGSYGWVDRTKQIVRIPVERAYAIIRTRQGTGAPRQVRPGAPPGGQP